ncbi:MAG: YaiO family outer membrane beta-barrel protein [Woeseiaceae bacterium]|nr:YaiO family outer membrane beta-barrel protein [Woeseiaceae bacterium]
MSPARTAPLAVLLSLLSAISPVLANPAERFDHVRELMHVGHLDAALAALDTLRAEHPEDVDYAFARAQVLIRLGRDDDAIEQLAVATTLAPEYEAVWRTRFNLLARRQESGEIDEIRLQAAERFPQSTWWREPEPEYQPAWMLLVGGGTDSLSNNLPGWDNQFVEAHYEHGDQARYMGRVARDARNNVGDVSLALAAQWRKQPWFTGVGIAFAGDPEFQARTGIEIHAGRQFGDGWTGTLRYRHRDYDNTTIGTLVADVEKYVSDFRVAYTLGASRLQGASIFTSHAITGNWYYREASSLGLSLSGGREAEAIGGGRVIETDVRSLSLTGRHQFNKRLGLHWWLGLHEQGDLYRRRFIGMAVSIGI